MASWGSRQASRGQHGALNNQTTNYTHASPSRTRGGSSRMTSDDVLDNAYGIPTLPPPVDPRRPPSSTGRQGSSSASHGHSRSRSHPFPSLFSGKRNNDGISARLESTDDEGFGSSSRSPAMAGQGQRSRAPEKDLTTGKCMTCASNMKWPQSLGVFRCSICQTINDLKTFVEQNHYSQLNNGCQVQPLSIRRTKHLIDQCITSYLMGYLNQRDSASLPVRSPNPALPARPHPKMFYSQEEQSWATRNTHPHSNSEKEKQSASTFLNDSGDPSVSQHATLYQRDLTANREPQMRSQSLPGTTEPHGCRHVRTIPKVLETSDETVAPARTPPPPPGNNLMPIARPAGRSSTEDGEKTRNAYDPARTIFKALEEYIIMSFQHRECINVSFAPVRSGMPLAPERRTGERTALHSERGQEDIPDDALSRPDSKIVSIGHSAELGSWWSGNESPSKVEQPQSNRKNAFNENYSNSHIGSNLKSPRIDWQDLNQWYQLVSTAGQNWETYLGLLPIFENEQSVEECLSQPEHVELENSFRHATNHIQRVLLKATENLLKRPGAQLKGPDDIRFLLIVLFNPLLYPSSAATSNSRGRPNHGSVKRSDLPSHTTDRSRSRSQFRARAEKRGGEDGTTRGRETDFPHRPPPTSTRTGPGQHSGIIKRILGLLSNLSNECHLHLVSWFSRLPETQFRQITELIGSFVSYRLTRRREPPPEERSDLTGGLIPSMSASGYASSAALHAALEAANNPSKPESRAKTLDYHNDWQIKAAARVMQLLSTANTSGPSRRRPTPSSELSGNVTQAARRRAHRHGQILATSDFYNTLLDYTDIIADFEAWESKRGKFTFCQYPFFISIGAKIKILQYDARRQQEVKAREAFFDSIMTRKSASQFLVLKVRRQCLVDDSLKEVSAVVGAGGDEIKKGLRIDFKGEEGIDAGGLRKEWFLLLVREVFNPDHGMFVYDEESNFCYFNPAGFETSDQYFLVGVVLGLAIYNSTILDIALPPFAFRKLLAAGPASAAGTVAKAKSTMTYTLEDLEEFRPALARGLRQLLEFDGDVEGTFCRDFVADVERYGATTQVPLCPGGESKPVTNANRREFVDLYVRYLLDHSVTRQFEPFKRGFWQVCAGNALSLFQPEEIELLVRGSEETLDVASLRAVAQYEGWKTSSTNERSPTVDMFWDVLEKADPKEQRSVLSFITGSDRIPATGAANLVIKIVCSTEDQNRYPTARTCFNALYLPKYRDLGTLQVKLWEAVRGSEGFGLK